MFIAAKSAVVAEPCSRVHPMLSVLYGVAYRLTLSKIPSTAVAITYPRKGVFRVVQFPPASCISKSDRIVEYDMPPAGVAAEEGHIPTVLDERLNMRAHVFTPVLIMADAE